MLRSFGDLCDGGMQLGQEEQRSFIGRTNEIEALTCQGEGEAPGVQITAIRRRAAVTLISEDGGSHALQGHPDLMGLAGPGLDTIKAQPLAHRNGVEPANGMTLLYAASISEVFKSAYLAVPKGQLEAGLSIGLTTSQTLIRIICPQALRFALPNISNAILNLLKDTALAYTIGLADVMGTGNLIIGQNMGNYSLETYTAVALIYWGLALILALVSQGIEAKYDKVHT